MDIHIKYRSTHLMSRFHLLQNFVVTNFFCVVNLLDLNKTQRNIIIIQYSPYTNNLLWLQNIPKTMYLLFDNQVMTNDHQIIKLSMEKEL